MDQEELELLVIGNPEKVSSIVAESYVVYYW